MVGWAVGVEGRGEAGLKIRMPVGVLRLPGRELGAFAHNQPDRIDACHRTKPNDTDAQLCVAHDFPGVGIQRLKIPDGGFVELSG